MFLDMVNVIQKTFQFSLLQMEFYAPFQWSLKNLFVTARVQKKTILILSLIETL
jgi:hypothetical protein